MPRNDTKKILKAFWTEHKDCGNQLKIWYHEAERAVWKSPPDIKKQFATAGILENNRVVFNIKGNTYTLVTRVNYDYGIMWIRFIGTHAEYDKINASQI